MRHEQTHDIQRRSSAPIEPGLPERCAAWGFRESGAAWRCDRPTQRASGTGLSATHCKYHVEFHRRHGSYSRRSYLKSQLEPFRRAATKWLSARRDDRNVARVLKHLQHLIDNSGRRHSAYDVRWLEPDQRANAALANLREEGKTGEQLLIIVLTIHTAVSELGPRGDREFRYVQIAKLIHRLASGTHRTRSGHRMRSKYPRPEGAFMRTLGRRVEDVAAIAFTPEDIQEVIHLRDWTPKRKRGRSRKV